MPQYHTLIRAFPGSEGTALGGVMDTTHWRLSAVKSLVERHYMAPAPAPEEADDLPPPKRVHIKKES